MVMVVSEWKPRKATVSGEKYQFSSSRRHANIFKTARSFQQSNMAATVEPEITVDNPFNRDDDKLPYALFNPETEGKLTWICNYGSDGKMIVGVFANDMGDGTTQKEVRQLEDAAQARYIRDELLENGWREITPPKVNFTSTGVDGKARPLNRKQKRYLARKVDSVIKGKTNQ